MKRSACMVLLVFLSVLTAAAQETAPAPTEPASGPVATVNGIPIPRTEYEAALEEFMRSNKVPPNLAGEQLEQVRRTVLDGLIGTELLYQKARSIPIEVPQSEIQTAMTQFQSGFSSPEEFAAALAQRGKTPSDMEEMLRRNMMVQKMIQEQVLTGISVSDIEVQKYYDENPAEMMQPEAVRASHIFVASTSSDSPEARTEARKKIDEALRRAKLGTDFADVARLVSEDRSAARGGDMGFVARGQTVPQFEEKLFGLEIGALSDVFVTEKGFHIIKATEKRAEGNAAFEEVRQGIKDYLQQVRSVEALETLVASLRVEGKVEVF